MTTEDREFLLKELAASRDEFVRTLAGVDSATAKRCRAGCWSVLDCVEHCVFAEQAMLGLVMSGGDPVERTDRSRFEAALFKHAATRVRKIEAPMAMLPAGAFETIEEALEAFVAARSRSIEFVESCTSDLRDRMVSHPVGRITGYECLLLLIQHPRRHAVQIAELRSV